MTKGRRDRDVPSRAERPVVDELSRRQETQGRSSSFKRKSVDGHRKQGASFAFLLVPAVIVIVLGVGFGWYVTQPNSAPANTATNTGGSIDQASLLSDVAWPSYVSRGPNAVKEAYQYAVLQPSVLKYMPCYCGCGQHNGHRSNEDCFIANMNQGGRTIAFEQHGST